MSSESEEGETGEAEEGCWERGESLGAGRVGTGRKRPRGDMQIQSSGPQCKASSVVLSPRCVLESQMEIHR